MSAPQSRLCMSSSEYLEWEAQQPEKYEYFQGEVYAMVGACDAHVTVALNIASLLRNHLRGTPCRVYISDMKLRVEAADTYFYPDVFVSCSAADHQKNLYKSEPSLIVEVLSDSTAAYDRGAKFGAYRRLESLKEYLLIDPSAFTVELFRRGEDNLWVLHPLENKGELELTSVGMRITGDALFEGVTQ